MDVQVHVVNIQGFFRIKLLGLVVFLETKSQNFIHATVRLLTGEFQNRNILFCRHFQHYSS